MVYQKKTINNVPTKIPLSNSAPVGNPIGTIISTYKKIQPRNYLYCDGSTFDETLYPALYLYLGTNVLPDYRECAIVGAEKNTTDVFDSTETNPSTGLPGTQNHDVYTQGEFKDDQFQTHKHYVNLTYPNGGGSGVGTHWGLDQTYNSSGYWQNGTDRFENPTNRYGPVTRGKRKAVYYYIKAVDGVDISDEDTFLNTVKNYTYNQNLLSDFETFTLTDTNMPVQYDGYLLVRTKGSDTWGCSIYVNDIEVGVSYAKSTATITITIPVNKGDNVRYTGTPPDGTRARFYKLRDYTGR